jgi:hypothetical protein
MPSNALTSAHDNSRSSNTPFRSTTSWSEPSEARANPSKRCLDRMWSKRRCNGLMRWKPTAPSAREAVPPRGVEELFALMHTEATHHDVTTPISISPSRLSLSATSHNTLLFHHSNTLFTLQCSSWHTRREHAHWWSSKPPDCFPINAVDVKLQYPFAPSCSKSTSFHS